MGGHRTAYQTVEGRHRGEGAVRLAGCAGVVGVLLATAAFVLDQMWLAPATTWTSAQIAASVGRHREALLVAMFLNTATVSLLLVFGAGVWMRLRHATGAEAYLLACFVLGLVSLVTLILAGFTPFLVLAYRSPAPSDARLLYDASFGLLATSAAPTIVALGSYAALVLRIGELPRSTAGLAAISAVAHVTLFASFVARQGFFSLEGPVIIFVPLTLFAWVANTGIAMMRGL